MITLYFFGFRAMDHSINLLFYANGLTKKCPFLDFSHLGIVDKIKSLVRKSTLSIGLEGGGGDLLHIAEKIKTKRLLCTNEYRSHFQRKAIWQRKSSI